jgi:PAS domain S-box-containing protein
MRQGIRSPKPTPTRKRAQKITSILVHFGTPVVAVAMATGLRLYLDPQLTWKAPFIFFVLAIVISSREGGIGSGLMATALSVLAGDYFFLEPRLSFKVTASGDGLNLAIFAGAGVLISVIAGQLHVALARSVAARERLQVLSDTVPQFIWTNTTGGECDSMNARWYEYTGAAPGSALGHRWKSFVHPEDLPELSRARTEMFAAGTRATREFRFRRHDGVYRWFESRVAPLRDADGQVVRWFGSTIDVDDARRLREVARVEAERFAQIVASAPGVICQLVLRPDGTTAMPFASAGIREIFGLDPADVASDAAPLFARIHPDDRPRVQDVVLETARTLSIFQVEYRVLHPEKGVLWVEVRSSPVREADGTINWFGFATDITAKKVAGELLQQKRGEELYLLQTLIEQAPTAMLMLDRSLRQIQASQKWLDDVGLTRENAIGRLHYECFPLLPEHMRESCRRCLAGETLSGHEDHFVAPDGTDRWADWRLVPWGDAGEATGGLIVYTEDVTARVLAQREVRRGELEYRALFENMAEGVFHARMIFEGERPVDYVYLSVNRAFVSMTGLTDAVGRRTSEVHGHTAETDPELFELLGRVATTGAPEKRELFSNRRKRWLSLSAYCPEAGSVVVLMDVITKRKQAELEARRWQRAFEQSETPIALVDAATESIEAVNEAYARKLGYSAQELVGHPFNAIYPASELANRTAALRAAEAGDGHAMFESRHVRKDGSEFPVMVDITAVRDDTGTIVSRVKIAHDLTEVRRAGAALREREHTIRALLDSAAQAIIAVNPEGRIVLANKMAGKMFGYGAAELPGLSLDTLLPEEIRDQHAGDMADYFGDPHVRPMGVGLSLQGLCRNGTRFPVEISLSHIETEAGPMAIAFVNDVTARQRAECEIRELNASLERRVKERTEELEATNQELESFAYSVSHDLRAPLRGIDGWSLALLEDYGDGLDEQAQKYLGRVRGESQRMGTLIDDLLQLSRVTSTAMERAPVDLTAIAARVEARLRKANPERALTFHIEPGLTARGDARLLEIVLTNLFDNAVKFTAPRAESEIWFSVSQQGGEDVFQVRDNGVGFDMKYSASLFGPFQRLHKQSEFSGTGIGLATVKRVVHRHGGHVQSEAEVDGGASFSFTLGGQP